MEYKEHEILDILKSVSDNPEKILLDWNINKANTLIDLKKQSFPYFIYSFPIILDNEEVATITLASLYGVSNVDNLIQKYLGHQEYIKTWSTLSHDTYKYCYLTIHKEFKLPKIVDGMNGKSFIGKDAIGNNFEFMVSYGYPEKEKDSHQYYTWVDGGYRFDNGVSIKFKGSGPEEGWSLGEKINENIKKRIETK